MFVFVLCKMFSLQQRRGVCVVHHLLILIAKFSITAYELIYELSHT